MDLQQDFEFRDSKFVGSEEFWKARARCAQLGLSCLGNKEDLIRRFELFSFNSENMIPRQKASELEKHSESGLEKYAGVSWLSAPIVVINETSPHLDINVPWKVLPELSHMNRKIASGDVLKGIGALMRPTCCFYNTVQDPILADRLVGVAYLPFTPATINRLNESQVRHIASALGISPSVEDRALLQAVERQKLMELVYAVIDSEALHGVSYCQSPFGPCPNLASSGCANFMCASCCQAAQQRSSCLIHDRYVNLFLNKLRSVYTFEEKFTKSMTLRLELKEPLRKIQLYRLFEGFSVRWDKVEVWYNDITQRIQLVYISFATEQDAIQAYAKRSEIQSASGVQLKVSNLPTGINELAAGYVKQSINLDCVLLISYPMTHISKIQQLPNKYKIYSEFVRLCVQVTDLPAESIRVDPGRNEITGKFTTREFCVVFPEPQYAAMVYEKQPYFQFLVAHRMNHLASFPFVKPSYICVMWQNPAINIHQLCGDCIGTFANHPLLDVPIPPINTSPEEAMSVHSRRFLEISPNSLSSKLWEKTGKFHVLIRHLLDEGVYNWYKPLFYSNIESLKKANRELQQVLDSGTARQNLSNKREGKIFNFLSSPPISREVDGKQVTEALDNVGRVYQEYSYGLGQPVGDYTFESATATENSYTLQDYEDDTTHIGYNIRENFHFFLAGVDPYRRGVKEMVANELQGKLGHISIEDIILMDRDSLLGYVAGDGNVESNFDSYHRICCVRMKNIMDSLKLVTGEVTLNLPLANGHSGMPLVIPSNELGNYIQTTYEELMRNPTLRIPPETNQIRKIKR